MLLDQLLPEEFAKLGIMGWPLLVSSILVLFLILERLSFFIFFGLGSAKIYKQLSNQLHSFQSQEKSLRDEILSNELSRVSRRFARGIGALRLLAAVAPLLGLLGTILGIIAAFQVIAATEGPVTPNLIADGLWEALLTTAAGLIIALPSVIAAGIFGAWKQALLATLQARLNDLSIQIDLQSETPAHRSNAAALTEDRLAS